MFYRSNKMEYIESLIYLVPLLLIAGVLDGIAGGGGIIAMPAYLLSGMPVHSIYACNKFQGALGNLTSCAKYIKDGYADVKLSLITLPFTVGASYLSTKLILCLDNEKIKLFIVCCLPVALICMFFKRKLTSKTVKKHSVTLKTVMLSVMSGILIGAYNALFGPGGGTIAMIIYSILLNYDLRVGNGNGKIIITVSNLTAAIQYIFSGYMLWHIAIPCACANMLGAYIGATVAMKKGEKAVLPAMLAVVAILIIQTILGLITGA